MALVAVATAALIAAIVVVLVRNPILGPSGPVVALDGAAVDATTVCAPLADSAVPGLRSADLALSGTVRSASPEEVEVVPDRVFRGAEPGLVRLRADTGGGPALDGPVLQGGDRVLLAATDGRLAGCGLSAVESPELRRYYDAAFD